MKINFTTDPRFSYLDEERTITFVNTSEYADLGEDLTHFRYRFNFGDGNHSDIIHHVPGDRPNIYHIYETPGEFNVSLCVWNNRTGERKLLTKEKYVRIRDLPSPRARFQITPYEPDEDIPAVYHMRTTDQMRLLNFSGGDFKRVIWESDNILTEARDIFVVRLEETQPDDFHRIGMTVINERGEDSRSFNVKVHPPEYRSEIKTDREGNIYVVETKVGAEFWDVQEVISHDFAKRRIHWSKL